MREKIKRIISIMIAMMLLITSVPINALAFNEEIPEGAIEVDIGDLDGAGDIGTSDVDTDVPEVDLGGGVGDAEAEEVYEVEITPMEDVVIRDGDSIDLSALVKDEAGNELSSSVVWEYEDVDGKRIAQEEIEKYVDVTKQDNEITLKYKSLEGKYVFFIKAVSALKGEVKSDVVRVEVMGEEKSNDITNEEKEVSVSPKKTQSFSLRSVSSISIVSNEENVDILNENNTYETSAKSVNITFNSNVESAYYSLNNKSVKVDVSKTLTLSNKGRYEIVTKDNSGSEEEISLVLYEKPFLTSNGQKIAHMGNIPSNADISGSREELTFSYATYTGQKNDFKPITNTSFNTPKEVSLPSNVETIWNSEGYDESYYDAMPLKLIVTDKYNSVAEYVVLIGGATDESLSKPVIKITSVTKSDSGYNVNLNIKTERESAVSYYITKEELEASGNEWESNWPAKSNLGESSHKITGADVNGSVNIKGDTSLYVRYAYNGKYSSVVNIPLDVTSKPSITTTPHVENGGTTPSNVKVLIKAMAGSNVVIKKDNTIIKNDTISESDENNFLKEYTYEMADAGVYSVEVTDANDTTSYTFTVERDTTPPIVKFTSLESNVTVLNDSYNTPTDDDKTLSTSAKSIKFRVFDDSSTTLKYSLNGNNPVDISDADN